MYILAFETTGENASVACIDEEGRIICEKSGGVRSHLQSLMPMTRSLMQKNGIGVGDISCVAASCGPGSFTGIRIGVASARAFAQAAEIPCIPVPTLQAFVYNVPEHTGLFCPILDARRGQVYGGAFFWDEKKADIGTAVEGGAYTIGEYLESLRQTASELRICDIMFFGDGIGKYRSEIIDRDAGLSAVFADDERRLQKASSAAMLALKLYREGKQVHYNEFTPMYMRKAEAERKLEAIDNG